jgi:adenylate cyclase
MKPRFAALRGRWRRPAPSIRRCLVRPASHADLGAAWRTVLIAEVVDSARLFGTYQDAAIARWIRCLESVHQRLDSVACAHELRVTGDGFLIAFDDAATAARFACDIRLAARSVNDGVLPEAALHLRTGLAAGTVRSMANDWTGVPVERAHALGSLAHGEEILVDASVRHCLVGGFGCRLGYVGQLTAKGGRRMPAYRIEEPDGAGADAPRAGLRTSAAARAGSGSWRRRVS